MPKGPNRPRIMVIDDPIKERQLSAHDTIVISKAMAIVRPPVAAFAEKMELELRANDHKGGWQDLLYDQIGDVKYLLRRLKQEVWELERSIEERADKGNNVFCDKGKIVSEAADVANFAMMIADTVGGLRDDGKTYGR